MRSVARGVALEVVLLCGVAAAPACYRRQAVVPAELARATRVVLHGWEDADPRRPYVLTRPDSIAAIARFVRALADGWAPPPSRLELPRVRAEFFRGAEPLAEVGLTSLGDTAYFVAPRGSVHVARRATPAEVRTFTAFFGIVGVLYVQ